MTLAQPCRLCNGNLFSEHTTFQGTTLRYQGRTFPYARCNQCGSINLEIPFSPDYTGYPNREFIPRLEIRRFVKLLSSCGIDRNQRILDYGCGKGTLLKHLKTKGYKNVAGYDPFQIDYANIPSNQKFDLIYLNHALEHLQHFPELFDDLDKLLHESGIVISIHPSSTRIPRLDPECPFQSFTIHAPFHTFLPSDSRIISLFHERGYRLRKEIPFDAQKSGILRNNRVYALFLKTLGGVKENALEAGSFNKLSSALRFPFLFLTNMFWETKDPYATTLIFEKN